MKSAGYIFILTILLLQSGWMLLILSMQQGYVQYKMSEKLKSNKATFEKIMLSTSEFEKSKINKNEIFLNGKMYDVKSATVYGDIVELVVINDIEEENILVRIKNFVKNTSVPNNKNPDQLHQLISLIYLQPFSESLLFIPSFNINLFCQPKLNIVSNYPDILSPPPRLV